MCFDVQTNRIRLLNELRHENAGWINRHLACNYCLKPGPAKQADKLSLLVLFEEGKCFDCYELHMKIYCAFSMSSLLWNNSVVILNTYCCDHASAWTDLNPEKTCLSAQSKRQRPHFIGWFGIIMVVLSLSNSLCAYQGCVPFGIELRVLFIF